MLLTLLCLLLLVPVSGQAATYYLDPARGSDSNAGTQGSPWQTLLKVKTTVAAGDTVNILGGTYTQSQVEPGGGNPLWTESQSKGSAGNPITIQANPGDTVIFDGEARASVWQAFEAQNGSGPTTPRYVVVRGLQFQHYRSGVIFVQAASHVAVVDCVIQDIYDGQGGALSTNYADHVIFQRNRIVNEGDLSQGWGGQEGAGDHGVYISDDSHDVVVSQNTMEKIAGYGVHLWNSHGAANTTSNIIIRQNTVVNAASSGLIMAGQAYANIYVYQNSFAQDAVPYAAIFQGMADAYVSFHNGGTFRGVQVVYNSGTGPVTYGPVREAPSSVTVDPNSWGGQAVAPCPALTTTVSAGSGTTLPVADAGYFMDGFGLVAGDQIQVGCQTQVQVTAIDYASNVLTVTPGLTWTAGQSVSFVGGGTGMPVGRPRLPTPRNLRIVIR